MVRSPLRDPGPELNGIDKNARGMPMLNYEIAAIAADLVDGALAGRDLNLHMQIRAKQNFLASKGYAMSGAAIHEIVKLANEELRTVFATTWTVAIRQSSAWPNRHSKQRGWTQLRRLDRSADLRGAQEAICGRDCAVGRNLSEQYTRTGSRPG